MNFRRHFLRTLPLFLAPLFAPLPSPAWGPEGHEIVAAIALRRLTPTARDALAPILGSRNLTDLDVASWPDIVRGDREIEAKYPKNAHWHFIDFDVTLWYGPKFRLEPTPDGNDAVAQIPRWAAVLADASRSPEDRLDALRFVVHLTGDIHEPMHCAQRYGDMGGNMLRVDSFAGHCVSFDPEVPAEYSRSVHSVWDKALVAELMCGHSMRAVVLDLDAGVSYRQASHWVESTPYDWAVESYWIARKVAYRFTDGTRIPNKWTAPGLDLTAENYIDEALPYVRVRLQKAGVRLAYLLNSALDPAFAALEDAARADAAAPAEDDSADAAP
ncbi:MAG: hypothetical protein IK066_08015 [Kiritimatiellae bacterium]|nr:hypothetical protein [Kiritimatiellia bacterium]